MLIRSSKEGEEVKTSAKVKAAQTAKRQEPLFEVRRRILRRLIIRMHDK